MTGRWGIRLWLLCLSAALVVLALPAGAGAHIERPSYWPNPAPDRSVHPAAGGHVPGIRSLGSALNAKLPGKTLVVCHKDSMSRLKSAIKRARKHGFNIRPHAHRSFSKLSAARLLRINKKLAKMCRYREIQPAATAVRNNGRIVIMPGIYTEPTARKVPAHEQRCQKYTTNTEFGDPGALSYAYGVHCPNDQSLVAVLGRKVGPGKDPDPPHYDRHNIPNLGACIRCNVQLEGSGVNADDVVIDAGRVKSGNHGPADAKKDVGIRIDRADGFVLRNLTARHAAEHGIYILESDGYWMDRFKAYYNGEYGLLTFVEDHGIISNCDTTGHPDSGVYPGAPAETGVQRDPGTHFRYNQVVRDCDLHHNLAGYSATDGNAVHVVHNNFYDNALGITTDVVTAAGHPGFPDDSSLFENNNFYSNNFNTYSKSSDVEPKFPFPVGTGMWIAGGNWHQVRNNHFWDNWRRGTMIFSVPDAIVCGPDSNNNAQKGCSPGSVSTSFYNSTFGNVMGAGPKGQRARNGTDFWFDDYPGSRGNCWYWNTGPYGITYSPRPLPDCNSGQDPNSSIGIGNPVNEGELGNCAVAFETRTYDPSTCPWVVAPSKPSSAHSASYSPAQRTAFTKGYARFCSTFPSSATCKPSLAGTVRLPRAFEYTSAPRPKLPSTFNLQLYLCKDWKKASEDERRYVIARIRTITGGQVSGRGFNGRGTVLPDDEAHRLFDNTCAARYARGFLLYKLYGLASVFVGATP